MSQTEAIVGDDTILDRGIHLFWMTLSLREEIIGGNPVQIGEYMYFKRLYP